VEPVVYFFSFVSFFYEFYPDLVEGWADGIVTPIFVLFLLFYLLV
jgi:hypothetical protein